MSKLNIISKTQHPDIHYKVMDLIQKTPNITQRQLASKLGISLGSMHYCVKALAQKGWVKVGNFKKNPNKSAYLYSYDWNRNRLENFKNDIKKIQSLNSNIAITSSSNEYKVPSRMYTLIDQKVLFDEKKFDYFGLKKLYFKNRLIHSKSNINQLLKKFAIKENIKYLNREDFMCDVLKKECDYVDNDGNKLLYDYGHYTKFGAKFFGNKIYEINWLQLN